MRVGEKALVVALKRPVPSHEDRSRWEGAEGLIIRRLNVPWDPDVGELWELRFDNGETVVFSSSELAVVKPDGRTVPIEMEELRESWGKAPRGPSVPFRRVGAGIGAAPAVLALLVFALAGVLLVWAGVASGTWWFSAAGVVLVLIGIAAAGVLIS